MSYWTTRVTFWKLKSYTNECVVLLKDNSQNLLINFTNATESGYSHENK